MPYQEFEGANGLLTRLKITTTALKNRKSYATFSVVVTESVYMNQIALQVMRQLTHA
jgi:hypothetical protein